MNRAEFLRALAPHGPWWLCSIVPDGALHGEPFVPADQGALERYVATRNAGANLYYQPNHVGSPPRSGKPDRDNISAVRALFVDCDPRVGEDWHSERRRILERLSKFPLAPSLIVSSGRGFQALWLLAEPYALGGGEEREKRVAHIEGCLKWLVNELEGDHAVAQIAALLRLPDTNWLPNKVKKAKGFVEPLKAEVVQANPDRRYRIEDFKSFEPGVRRERARRVQLSSNLPAVDPASLDQWDATGRLRNLAVHGEFICEAPVNLEEPKKGDNSRSAWLFDFLCNAIRNEVPDEIIAAVILDPKLRISASVLEKKNSRKVASDQLGKAHEAVEADTIEQPLSDIGNGRRLVAASGGLLRYCYSMKSWLTYEDGRWRRDEGNVVMGLCKRTALDLIKEFRPGPDDKVGSFLSWAKKSQSSERLSAMARLAQDEVAVAADQLDADNWLLNCRNGTIDLRSGLLRQHDPADLLTKQAQVDYVPGAECPFFSRFVEEIMLGDSELIELLRRAIGYSLTGDVREQVFFLPYGGGANGKSTLLKIITTLMGDYAHTAQMAAFIAQDRISDGPTEALAAMRGARLVIASEIRPGAPLDEQAVKLITGGDRIRARFLNQNSFEYDPTFKVWLVVNHLPAIRSQDHGMWRRIRVVPFDRQFKGEEQDRTLADRIIANELPGVLNWALQGCLAWQRDGLSKAAKVAEATRVYKVESDVLANWLDDECRQGNDLRVPVKFARANYLAWCERNGERPLPQRAFGDALVGRGFQSQSVRYQGEKTRCYLRLALVDRAPLAAVGEREVPNGRMPF